MSATSDRLAELYELEPRIAGDELPCPITDFVRACHVLVGEEQRKVSPDTAVIATLCNAVRMAREHLRLVDELLTLSRDA